MSNVSMKTPKNTTFVLASSGTIDFSTLINSPVENVQRKSVSLHDPVLRRTHQKAIVNIQRNRDAILDKEDNDGL
jgi:hypothetical protein